MKNPISPSRPKSKGFTLVELLVVILVIVVLAGVVIGASLSARRSAAKVSDMNNLRNLSTAAMAAGSDNVGRLPQIHDPNSVYPYYLVGKVALEASGIYKESCYAPTRNITGGAPKYEWWYRSPSNTPTHYVYFANDAAVKTNAWFLKNGNLTPPDRKEYRGAIPYDEIIKDQSKAFARSVTDDAWYSVLWAGLCRDDPSGNSVAAIMQNGKALGVNVMYLDGHVQWQEKNVMKPRYKVSGYTVYW